MFTACVPFPGVTHITDAMGVSFTLIEGEDSALLFDTGYGLEDVSAFIRTRTEKPLQVILSHGHHDHILGARWFSRVCMDPADREEFLLRTGRAQRESVLRQAAEKGIPAPADYLDAPVSLPDPLVCTGRLGDFSCCELNLGGLRVLLIRVPGHTPGSVVLYLPSLRLLLTGDDWNPCTWVWFPSSLPVRQWKRNMQQLLPLLEQTFGGEILRVLCSHQPAPREASELKDYLSFMTEDRLLSAAPVDMGSPVRTRQVLCPERNWVLLFDAEKA